MTIYEIDKAIADLLTVDEETGEVVCDIAALESLQMERDRKVENLALAFKNLSAEAAAIKAEEEALAKRRKSVEAKANSAKEYLAYVLSGEPFKTPKVAVTYRKSQVVQTDKEFLDWAKANAPYLLRQKDPEADKKAISAALKDDAVIPHAEMVTNISMTIK